MTIISARYEKIRGLEYSLLCTDGQGNTRKDNGAIEQRPTQKIFRVGDILVSGATSNREMMRSAVRYAARHNSRSTNPLTARTYARIISTALSYVVDPARTEEERREVSSAELTTDLVVSGKKRGDGIELYQLDWEHIKAGKIPKPHKGDTIMLGSGAAVYETSRDAMTSKVIDLPGTMTNGFLENLLHLYTSVKIAASDSTIGDKVQIGVQIYGQSGVRTIVLVPEDVALDIYNPLIDKTVTDPFTLSDQESLFLFNGKFYETLERSSVAVNAPTLHEYYRILTSYLDHLSSIRKEFLFERIAPSQAERMIERYDQLVTQVRPLLAPLMSGQISDLHKAVKIHHNTFR